MGLQRRPPALSAGTVTMSFEKVAVVNSEALRTAAERVKNFSQKLVSGEIFQSPPSHVFFRIPLAKSLLKYLLKWRLAKEEQIHS